MSVYVEQIIAGATPLGCVDALGMPTCCHDWRGPGMPMPPFGKAMHDVWMLVNPHNPEAPALNKDSKAKLEVLSKFLGVEAEQFQTQFNEYVRMCQVRAAGETAAGPFKEAIKDLANWGVLDLSKENRGVWGSKAQYLFGKIVIVELYRAGLIEEANCATTAEGARDMQLAAGNELEKAKPANEAAQKADLCKFPDMHGCWGAMLMPTGGIAGAGNANLSSVDTAQPLIIHSIVHDAFGYCLNYHQVGCGYNYLGTMFTVSSTTSPMACQYAGINYARYKKLRSGNYRFGDIWCGHCVGYSRPEQEIVDCEEYMVADPVLEPELTNKS